MTANAVNKTLEIVESEYRPNQSSTGMVLQCLAQEVGGPNEGQLGYLLFDLENDDECIQERGQRAFAALRRAVDVLAPTDSSELHWKAFQFPFSNERVDFRAA